MLVPLFPYTQTSMIRRIIASFAALALVQVVAVAQPPQSYNTTLFDKLNPEPPEGGGRYSALWGYTAPNGREYALLGGYSGTYIIDVTSKPIKQVAFIQGPQSGWREMKTYRTYAYVVSEGGGGLQIIDLSNLPASATLVKSETSRYTTAHTVAQQGKYLYVNGTGASAGVNGGTIIYDLTNPTSPVVVGEWKDRYAHDCTIRNDTMYVAAINAGQLDIVSLGATRANPMTVASIQYPGAGTHNADLTPDGSFIMTTDEVGSTPKTLKVWDRRDLNNIKKVADFTPVPGEIVHNVHSKGSIAYVAWYSAGTRIIDMSVPSEPAELGYFDTYPGAVNSYVGNWETYPYLPSGKILASDMQTGLYVFTFSGATRGSVRGTVRDSVTGQAVPGAVITLTRFGRPIVADAQGGYSYAGAVDSLTFTAAADDYRTAGGVLALTEAGTARDILLSPIEQSNFSVNAVDAATGADIGAFGYRVMERPTEGRASANPQSLRVPKDSSYTVYVGAWGFRPKMVPVRNPSGVLNVRLDSGYFDDAELDLGWSLGDVQDDARGGRWERGTPIATEVPDGTAVQPGADNSGPGGPSDTFDHAFITGIVNSDPGQPGSNDVDDGRTTLTSPPMDLRQYRNPIITCAIWYSRDSRRDVVNDTLDVMISRDGGADWRVIDRIVESPQQWMQRRYRLRDYYVDYGAQTLFRIVASDLNPQSLVEAGLDDFAVADSGRAMAGVRDAFVDGGVASAALAPNPLSSIATLRVDLERAQADARLELYDASGRMVRALAGGAMPQGAVTVTIDASTLPSGRYTWRLRLDDGSVASGPVVVVR